MGKCDQLRACAQAVVEATSQAIAGRVKQLALVRAESFWVVMAPCFELLASSFHEGAALEPTKQQSAVDVCASSETRDMCQEMSKFGLPDVYVDEVDKEQAKGAAQRLDRVRETMHDFLNNWAWESSGNRAIDVFDQKAYALWHALSNCSGDVGSYLGADTVVQELLSPFVCNMCACSRSCM